MNYLRYLFCCIFMLIASPGYADVYITISAKLIRPACIVTAENGEKELFINFNEVSFERLNDSKKSFGILVKECDLKKSLQVYLSPREGKAIRINDEVLLATSIDGLGIRFSGESTGKVFNLNEWNIISPVIDGGTGKFVFNAELITNKTVDNITAGMFNASMSIMIDYL
ncbi:TPA: fimbrial protein [Klebsiella aerogenes]